MPIRFCVLPQVWQQTTRAVGRARSKAEFIAKIGIVVEEADETLFWLELLVQSGIVKPEKLQDLLQEATELPVDLLGLSENRHLNENGRR